MASNEVDLDVMKLEEELTSKLNHLQLGAYRRETRIANFLLEHELKFWSRTDETSIAKQRSWERYTRFSICLCVKTARRPAPFTLSVCILLGDREQSELKLRLQVEDSPEVLSWRRGKDLLADLHYVAGVDISFVKQSPHLACTMLVVLSFPELKVSCQLLCV